MPLRFRANGFSLIEVLVSISILGILIAAAFSFTQYSDAGLAADDKRGGGVGAAVAITESMRNLGFEGLVNVCLSKKLLGVQKAPADASCVGQDSRTLVFSTATGPLPLTTPVNAAGDIDALGTYCAELLGCRFLEQGHVLDLNFAVSWIGVNGLAESTSQILRVRR